MENVRTNHETGRKVFSRGSFYENLFPIMRLEEKSLVEDLFMRICFEILHW